MNNLTTGDMPCQLVLMMLYLAYTIGFILHCFKLAIYTLAFPRRTVDLTGLKTPPESQRARQQSGKWSFPYIFKWWQTWKARLKFNVHRLTVTRTLTRDNEGQPALTCAKSLPQPRCLRGLHWQGPPELFHTWAMRWDSDFTVSCLFPSNPPSYSF